MKTEKTATETATATETVNVPEEIELKYVYQTQDVTRTLYFTTVRYASVVLNDDGSLGIAEKKIVLVNTAQPSEREIRKAIPQGSSLVSSDTTDAVFAQSIEQFFSFGHITQRPQSQQRKG